MSILLRWEGGIPLRSEVRERQEEEKKETGGTVTRKNHLGAFLLPHTECGEQGNARVLGEGALYPSNPAGSKEPVSNHYHRILENLTPIKATSKT